MRDIQVCDITMKQAAGAKAFSLSFKDKLELAKQLDKLGVSAIEAEGIESPKADSLRIKSLASLVKNCTLAVPVGLGAESVEATWAALKEAAKPRLQVEVAVSPATMEYIHHKKADGMLSEVAATVAACRALCDDVEFVAQDATRADAAYLRSIVAAAIEAGAGTVTIADAAGKMLPEEFAAFIGALKADLPQLEQVSLGISCSNELFMADACAVAAIAAGIDAFKGSTYPLGCVALDNVCKILDSRQDACDVSCSVRTTEINRAVARIAQICEKESSRYAPAAIGELDESISLSALDTPETVATMADFLSKLSMEIYLVNADGTKQSIFSASPDKSAQLTDSVLLGTFAKGETAKLQAVLHVPAELGSEYANRVGEVDWLFTVEGFNNEKPLIPTGQLNWPVAVFGALGVLLIAGGIIVLTKKKKNEKA